MKYPKISDMLGIVSKIAPPSLAESWDNPGLQLGDPAAPVSRIMVSLDATGDVIQAALESGCQLLVTHHPLIFSAPKSISTATPQGRCIHAAIRGGLSIISMHTNYDCADDGLNDLLARRLGLRAAAKRRHRQQAHLGDRRPDLGRAGRHQPRLQLVHQADDALGGLWRDGALLARR